MAFSLSSHLPPHIVCILHSLPGDPAEASADKGVLSPAVCSGGRHTSPCQGSALFPCSVLLLMGEPDTIHLAGNELCEPVLGHLYLPRVAPVVSSLKHGQLRETRAKSLLTFSSLTLKGLLSEALPRALEHGRGLGQLCSFCSCCHSSLGCLPLAGPRDDTGDLEIYMCSCKKRKRRWTGPD